MESNVLKEIGSQLKKLRIEKELTQEKLAYLTGTDPSYIRKVESGKVNISVKRLYAIASSLEISLSELFSSIND